MLPGLAQHAFHDAARGICCRLAKDTWKRSTQTLNVTCVRRKVVNNTGSNWALNQRLVKSLHNSARDFAAVTELKNSHEDVAEPTLLRCPDPFAWRKSQYTKKFTPRALRTRYELFYDSAEEIFDSDQSTWIEVESEPNAANDDQNAADDSEFVNLNMERADAGVFTVDELVLVLEQENMQDICCIAVPPEREYADYLLIASGNSLKHLTGTEEFIYRYYKRKKAYSDPFVLREGKRTNWAVMDFGNIVLHMMLPETRRIYDIERLWALGFQHDDQSTVTQPEWMNFLEQLEVIPVPLNQQFIHKSGRKPRPGTNLTALSVL